MTAPSSSTSPSGYATETIFASGVSPERWRFGATRNTQESSAKPTVRMSASTHAGAITAVRIAAADEQHQAGEEGRIDAEVDRVAGGGEADGAAEEVRVCVGVEVARDVQRLSDEQQRPRESRLGPVHPHSAAIASSDETPITFTTIA